MSKRFNVTEPLVLGLAGKAATGKTSIANSIVPNAALTERDGFLWDHLFFAIPLYDLVSIKTKILGHGQENRQLHAIHQSLTELFSTASNVPDYDYFVDLVHQIYEMPIEDEGKPRSFMQTAGTLLRGYDEEIFVRRLQYAMRTGQYRMDEDDENYFAVVVSDVRLPNEAEWVAAQPNGVLIKLETDDYVRFERIEERDGVQLTAEQRNHISEQIDLIPAELFDAVIDTTETLAEEAALMSLETIENTFQLKEFLNA